MDISRAIYRGVCVHTNTWVMGVPIFPKEEPNICHLISNECETVVHASSVGQFTGLRDKNAVAIYEGDLIQYNQHVTEVRYYAEMMAFGLLFHNENKWLHAWNCEDLILRLKIVGNAYEHPHLLK